MKDSKGAYAAMEQKILETNGLSKPEDLMAGARVRVPALPPIALAKPSNYNTRNLIPKTSVYGDLPSVLAGRTFNAGTLSYGERPKLSAASREGAPLVVQYLWLPRDAIEKERSLLGDNSPALEVHAELVTARLDAADSAPSTGPFPTMQERDFLRSRLALGNLQSPVLIVLDDGWPNDRAYQDSLKFLTEALNAIEAKFKYPFGPNIRALATSKTTSYPKENFHARAIAESLMPLTSLEPESAWERRRVKVVYLPMTTAQENAAGVLEDIIALRLFDDLMGGARGDDPPPRAEVTTLRAKAREIVSRLPKDIGVAEVKTDKAVIESVLWLCNLYARAAGQPYVANFSWTTPKLLNRYADIRFNLGLLISAAGNSSAKECSTCRPHLAYAPDCTCADNVVAEERWFAVRAVDGQDVVAVMNTARDGSLQCKSSIVSSRTKDPMTVALDGQLSPETCGTSFAAPRVAWLAAARLAYVDPKTLYPEEPERGAQLRGFLMRGRIGGSTRGDQFNLDVQRLFN